MVRSTDLGATWTLRGTTTGSRALDVVHRDTLFLFGVGSARRSIDGGATFTSMTGSQAFGHWTQGVDALDHGRVIAVGDGGLTATSSPINTVDDYEFGVSDWVGDGTEAFGVCLRATDATPTWTTNATCDQTADGAHWQGVPASPDPPSEVATTSLGDGVRTAQFRFGLRISPSQPPGTLSAGIAFTVLAPDP